MTIIIPARPFCDHDDGGLDEVDVKCFAVCCPECETIGPISRENFEDAIGRWNAAHTKNLSMAAEVKAINEWDRAGRPAKVIA